MALWAVRTRLTASVHVNLRGGWFSTIIRHADGPSEKRSRFYPTRAARERDYTKHARALITPVQKVRITDVPIYGQIPAGMSALTEQTIEGHVSLDTRSANISKNREKFALRVQGDSMIGAHIIDGDIVILEDSKEVQNGDIVAALIDGETTLKRYVMEHGRPYLKAENPLYPNLVPARELRIQGVMVSLVRKQMPNSRRKRA